MGRSSVEGQPEVLPKAVAGKPINDLSALLRSPENIRPRSWAVLTLRQPLGADHGNLPFLYTIQEYRQVESIGPLTKLPVMEGNRLCTARSAVTVRKKMPLSIPADRKRSSIPSRERCLRLPEGLTPEFLPPPAPASAPLRQAAPGGSLPTD